MWRNGGCLDSYHLVDKHETINISAAGVLALGRPTKPHFALTNDDGVEAPGIAALYAAVAPLGRSTVVAPADPQSGTSHRLTYSGSFSAAKRVIGELGECWAVAGLPADCARVAIQDLAAPVDWVLSGINEGANLGVDAYYSGTVAAVREGAILGKPGAAFSQYVSAGVEIQWERAAEWARTVLTQLLDRQSPAGAFWNVNFPSLPSGRDPAGIVTCPMSTDPLDLRYVAADRAGKRHYDVNWEYQNRQASKGRDVEAVFSGSIAVTPMRISLTDELLLNAEFHLDDANGEPG